MPEDREDLVEKLEQHCIGSSTDSEEVSHDHSKAMAAAGIGHKGHVFPTA